MTIDLDGLIPATVLPMTDGGVIDEAALRRYIRWVARQGPVALAINVDTGEGPHLTHAEKVRVLQIVGEETDLPLVAGVAGPFQTQAVAQARDYREAGASALLVFPIPAYLSAPLDPAIPVEYHRAIADVGLPLIAFQLQPMLGGVNFDGDTLRQLIEIDGVVAMKEASFDARRYLDTFRMVEQTPKYQAGEFTYLTGNDNFILESFMLGCTGALIGFGAIMVAEQVAMIEAWRDGRIDEARALGQARPAAGRRRLRRAGGQLPRAAEGVAADPRRARGRERAPAAAPARRGGAPPAGGDARGSRAAEGRRRMSGRRADVLIVGAGASGGVVARRLAAAGLRRRLPRAGRLARARRVPGAADRVRAAGPQAVGPQPERPRAARGLPGQRGRLRHRDADVQRRRRQPDPLRRRLVAAAPVGLLRPHAGRRGRRLADQLRGPAALLRADRRRVRRLGARRRPRLPGAVRAALPAAADRPRRAEGRPRPHPARLALVARHQLGALRQRPGAAGLRAVGHAACGAARRARRRAPTTRTGARRSPTAPSSSPARASAAC